MEPWVLDQPPQLHFPNAEVQEKDISLGSAPSACHKLRVPGIKGAFGVWSLRLEGTPAWNAGKIPPARR